MVKAILFDKDGTLFGFDATWAPWTRHYLHGIATPEAPFEALARAVGFEPDTSSFTPDSPVIAGTPDDAAAVLAPHLPHYDEVTLARSIVETAQDVVPVEAAPLHPLLAALAQDYMLGVMTNDAESAAREQLDQCGVTALFHSIIGYDSGYGAKPDPDPLLAFARLTGLAPGDIVMVGDSTHDLHAAKAAGLRAVGVLTGPAPRGVLVDAGADVVLADISELPGWLATL